MFKVICIDATMKNVYMIPPVVGDRYTVVGFSTMYSDSFYIKELPVDKRGVKASYQSKHFIPLSEISETSFEREYNKEKV